MSTLREDLIAAKALIDTPEKWGKGWERETPCTADAVHTVCGVENRRFTAMAEAMSVFNDHPDTTHADIMALFDRAIEAAK